jgi:O-antigen chain-terminating methyltransferase
MYRRLEDGLRGSAVEIRDAMRHYADLAATQQPAVDVGCGRGEFLELCRESKVVARGFDTNERSVADLKARGFDVELAGIPECFASMPADSLGSILAAHVVEHLPVDLLFAFFRDAARVLRKGGLLMIETPNAESLLMSASEFWRDPTHLAPRHPAALTLLGREHGFEVAEIRAVHPFPKGTGPRSDDPVTREIVEWISDRFFGPQDLRLILRKQ